jgi:hypothetical protein
MSMIHSSWALVGRRSVLMAGTAKYSTVRSITYRTQASASTASPIHSRRPALGGTSIAVTLWNSSSLTRAPGLVPSLSAVEMIMRLIIETIRRDPSGSV